MSEEAIAEITRPNPALLPARMLVDGEEVLARSSSFDEAAHSFRTLRLRDKCLHSPHRPVDLSLSEMNSLMGRLAFTTASAQRYTMLPHATRAFGRNRLAALAYSSCLAGRSRSALNDFGAKGLLLR